ncbi:MAG: DNA/RNA non-specific endonuclease [Prevotella sp.]|nr:DNA/RNA non-specific endonuclease [Prevotella sp.]
MAYDSDYRGSGYDRGHQCPSADCKYSREAMNECFLFSNMCPQTHKLNAGDWEQLETLCRKWAVAYDSIFIVCGPIIEKGKTYKTIGANKVTVPEQFFKVVLRLTSNGRAEAIGFIMNNDDSDRPIYTYAVTVDSVETRTGINFFSKLPKDVERRAEATFDCTAWKGLIK